MKKFRKKIKIQRTRFNSNIEPFVILVIGTIEKVTDFLENAPKSAKNSALIRKIAICSCEMINYKMKNYKLVSLLNFFYLEGICLALCALQNSLHQMIHLRTDEIHVYTNLRTPPLETIGRVPDKN